MNITKIQTTEAFKKKPGYHILTVGESGFSMLDIYARGQYGVVSMVWISILYVNSRIK